MGSEALYNNVFGDYNTGLGFSALYKNQEGNNNTAVGNRALMNNTASRNTAVGSRSLFTNASGTNNTAVGNNALLLSTGNKNVALGALAGSGLATGAGNVFVGYRAAKDSTSGDNKLFVNNDEADANALSEIGTGTRGSLIYGEFDNEYLRFDATVDINGVTTVFNTIESTEPTNGALNVDGGAGIEKRLNVGAEATFEKQVVIGAAAPSTNTSAIGGTSVSTNMLIVDGNASIGNGYINTVAPTNGLLVEGNFGLGVPAPAYKMQIDGDIVPSTNGLFTLGAPSLGWDTLYMASTIDFQTDLDFVSAGKKWFSIGATNGNVSIGEGLVPPSDAKLQVKGTSPNYIAQFENTNDGTGDGIKIKLGKASANNGLGALNPDNILSADKRDKLEGLLDCNKSAGDKGILLGQIAAEGLGEDVATILGLAAGVGNMVTGFINQQLNLPYNFPKVEFPRTKVFSGFSWSYDFPLEIGEVGFSIPAKYVGPFTIANSFELLPAIPQIDIAPLAVLIKGIDLGNGFKVPDDYTLENIDLTDLSFWGIPDICFEEKVNNPLSNENVFILFSDSDDKRMGSVRAESVEDWRSNYLLNPIFLYKLYGAITSAVDKKHARYHFKGKIFELADAYYNLGVEYSSGNGDYAEWLERINPDEIISAGDIVAVKGGKITKDLTNAEQIMVVSSHPIVLGNTPPVGQKQLGNNIAFMGQIPVKIMGAVSTGDYIVATSKIAGYGIAVSSEDMTLEDFKLAVGRAWEDNTDNGPKMVNTVVGVHNGDYLNILKRYEQKFRESESRMEAIEAKIDVLSGMITEGREIN